MIFIENPNIDDLVLFFNTNQSNQKHFRYYKNRDFNVTKNHLKTLIFKENDEILGYGHLDKENDIIWLGIMVSDNHIGKGIGNQIMDKLLENINDEIYLTVDIQNINAIILYLKKKFIFQEKKETYYIMRK